MTDQILEVKQIKIDPDQASTNFYWSFGKDETFNLQTTFRAALTDEEIQAHIDTVVRALTHIVKGVHGHARAKDTAAQHGSGNGKAVTLVEPPAPPAPQAGTPAAPTAPIAQPGQAQATAQIFTVIAETMETTPRADGKVDVKFYQAGHQFPDLYASKTPDVLCQMLAATGQWTPGHFAVAAKFPVKMLIEWVNSDKLNKNGKPYKNIVSIKAAQ